MKMTDQHLAEFYHLTEDGLIKCDLCPHNCKIIIIKLESVKLEKILTVNYIL